MVKIKICTMVKNEDDIIDEWINYHGKLFGYNNLIIIDNISTDNTFNICLKYIEKGINLTQEADYKRKGDLMTIMKNTNDCDIFIPLDIDEFICYYDKNNNTVRKDNIISYLEELSKTNYGICKMNYLAPINTNNEEHLKKFTHGYYRNYEKDAKSFIIKKNVDNNFFFDHGNHVCVDDYFLTDLLLIHYCERSHDQVLKKCTANVTGFGHSLDLNYLKKLSNMSGQHRINQMIYILENPSCNLNPQLCEIKSNHIYIKEILN